MKILIISQYFWPESFRINDLALALKERGHEVSILTGLPNYPAGSIFKGYGWSSVGRSDYEGLTLFRVPLFGRREGRSWQLALNYLSFVLSASLIGPFLCRDKQDVIFVFEPSPFTVGIPAILFRWIKKAPIIFWVQDLWPESVVATGGIRSPRLVRLIGKMVRFIYKRCDRVLVQSRGFIEPAKTAGAPNGRIEYFPNWAEAIYRPVVVEPSAPERTKFPNGFNILFAGNLGAAQSLQTLISAADKLRNEPDIHWLILGDGRQENWFREKVVELRLERTVHLLGRFPVEEMPRYFSLADLLLVTLRKDPVFAQTIPSKVQSYLACGKPIVGAIDGEGAKVIEESGAGFAVPAENSDALAESVLKLYQLPSERLEKMGKQGMVYYEHNF
ncbi:MAG: glycosyltransferase WbuB, partial [Gammaproteobacteria bacterium]